MCRLSITIGLLHRTTHDVEQLGGDGLLARLVVGKCELSQQFIGIVGSYLHSYDTGGVLAGQTV